MSGPTFVATFNDGEITRMTTHCADGRLDQARGVRLARQSLSSPQRPGTAGHDRWAFREAAG